MKGEDKILELLADMIIEGKNRDARLGQLEGRFENLEKRFDDLEKRFDNLEKRFDNLEKRFDNLEARFDKLEAKVDAMEARFEARISALEQEIVDLRTEMRSGFARIDNNMAILFDEIAKINETLRINQQTMIRMLDAIQGIHKSQMKLEEDNRTFKEKWNLLLDSMERTGFDATGLRLED